MATDYKEVRGKRGFLGKIAVGVFWLYQVLMVTWVISYWATVGEQTRGMSEAAQAGAVIGTTIGTGTILFFWVGGTVILGAILLISRPAKTWQAIERVVVLAVVTGTIALGAPATVSAQSVPNYDINAHCKRVSEAGGGGSYVIEKGCRDQERAALHWLERTRISSQIASHCDRVARSGGGAGSYVIYKGCVQQERRARDSMQ